MCDSIYNYYALNTTAKDSNPYHPEWQSGILTIKLSRHVFLILWAELNPHRIHYERNALPLSYQSSVIDGIEPTSLRSQHTILPFILLPPIPDERFEPLSLISKNSALPIRLHLLAWNGNWTHTIYFADICNTFMLSRSCLRRDLNPQNLNPKYSMYTISITKVICGGTWTLTFFQTLNFSLTRLPFRHAVF